MAAEPALDYLYCCLMAARASGMDKEFFTGMPLAEATHIKNAMNGNRFFRVKGGGKGLRKCAVRLAGATMTSIEFALKLPVRDFIEINNEVAAEWQKLRN